MGIKQRRRGLVPPGAVVRWQIRAQSVNARINAYHETINISEASKPPPFKDKRYRTCDMARMAGRHCLSLSPSLQTVSRLTSMLTTLQMLCLKKSLLAARPAFRPPAHRLRGNDGIGLRLAYLGKNCHQL
jgi:hypothetical protein